MIVYASAGSQELWADRACYRCERWLRDMDRLRPSLASSRVQALRAVEARPRLIHRVNNLPVQLSSFVGRKRESAQIGELLSSMRLLTLTGPGGIGKTRLALAVASAALDAYPDGVWLAELAGLADPLLVTVAVAHIFDVRGEAGTPLVESLAEILRSRSLLLVLDNCEHLVGACAELCSTLLVGCAGVQVLATSREPLGVEGEQVWPVPPLALPEANAQSTPERLQQSEAVRLFVDRARSSRPDFELTERNASPIAEVCRRLDGLPLAIELAAAQCRALAPELLLRRLDSRFRRLAGPTRTAPSRHQTLQATIDWSYGLLSETERILFSRLGVFAGGWTVEAAESVMAGEGLPPEELLPALLRLVDKSLVVAEPGDTAGVRYRLLELLRQDALERLSAGVEAEHVRDRHADFFLVLAEQSKEAFGSPEEGTAFDRLDREHDNLQAALAWLIGSGKTETAWRLGGALWLLWVHRGYVHEGRAWVERLLGIPGAEHTASRLILLRGAAGLALADGDLPAAESLGRASLALAQQLGDLATASGALLVLGSVARERGEYVLSRELHEQGVRAAVAIGRGSTNTPQMDPFGFGSFPELQNLLHVGWAAFGEGDCALARVRAEEARARAAEAGYPRLVAQALMVLGRVSYRQREFSAARSFLEQSLDMWNALGERAYTKAEASITLGCVERDLGKLELAASLLGDSIAILQRGGGQGIVRCLDAISGLAAAYQKPDRAFRLAAAAERLYEVMGCDSKRVYRFELQRWIGVARQALGAGGTAEVLAAGRALTRAAAIEEALATVSEVSGGSGGPPTTSAARLPGRLTRREREVVALIGRGMSNRQIAQELVIAERTAEHHVENILSKLGLESRTQVATWAVEHGAPGATQ